MTAVGGLLLMATGAASSITFFENGGFDGRRCSATSTVADFSNLGFNNRISSGRRVSNALPYNRDPTWGN